MRDIKPPVNFNKLHIDEVDPLATTRQHSRRVRPIQRSFHTISIMFVALILLGSGIGSYLLLLRNNETYDGLSTASRQDVPAGVITAKSLITKAKAVTKGEDKETQTDTNGTASNVFSAPVFRPSLYNFSVQPTTSYGFGSYGSKSTIADDLVFVQKVLVDNGLSETVLDLGGSDAPFVARYTSAGIVCMVSDQKPSQQPSSNTDYSIIIGCGDVSDYSASAAMLRPYFIVFASQTTYDTSKILMGEPNLSPSKTPGYSRATVPIGGSDYGSAGGFTGLFYVTPDGTLHYFTGTQNILTCRQYATDELKKAYLGEPCYDGATGKDQSTVKL